MKFLLVLGLWLVLVAAAWIWSRRWLDRERSRRRLDEALEQTKLRPDRDAFDEGSWLTRQLFLAGIRGPGATSRFVAIQAAAVVGAVLAGALYWGAGLHRLVLRGVEAIPGGTGDVVLPLAILAPWLLAGGVLALPATIVSRWRRLRVEQIEQDLPLILDLLATLGESGIGFDAALARILDTRLGERALAGEFRTFQADLLGGRTRVEAFRRLSRRMQVSTVSIFVSALVQADQLGMGLSAVLRRQADDLRDRRRQQAQAFAAALPVKRLFAMIPCFLPGLFVWPLGPVFVRLFEMADTFLRARVGP